MTLDPVARKYVLRSFTYGLYAVSAEHNGERGIFTANWVMQVSFEPPLAAVSIEDQSATLGLIRQSGRFAISPFAQGQRELAGALGRPRKRAGNKFATPGLETITTTSGVPALSSGIGLVVCEVRSVVEAGDSWVVIGEVIEATAHSSGKPLTMAEARFRHAG